jgi:hypothetical protein
VLARPSRWTARGPAASADPALAAAFAWAARDGSSTDPAVLAAVDAYVARIRTYGSARIVTGIRRSLAFAVPGRTTAAVFETLARRLVRYALRDRAPAVGIVRRSA